MTEATNGDVIAIDGKILQRSFNTKDEKSAIDMVSAWSTANGVVLGQEKTAEKNNEITAIPELLNSLAIKGCIITIDAMGCQKDIAEQIVRQKGDYLLALKGNQGNFYEEIDAGHGRVETRRAYAVDFKKYKKHVPEGLNWKKPTSVVMVEIIREGRGKFLALDSRPYISRG